MHTTWMKCNFRFTLMFSHFVLFFCFHVHSCIRTKCQRCACEVEVFVYPINTLKCACVHSIMKLNCVIFNLPLSFQWHREVSMWCLLNDCRTNSTLLIDQTNSRSPSGWVPYQRVLAHSNDVNSGKLKDNSIISPFCK